MNHSELTGQLRLGNAALELVPISKIESVVMMAPNDQIKNVYPEVAHEDWWYLMERPGLKMTEYIGLTEQLNEE
jgi:hypothetical protein